MDRSRSRADEVGPLPPPTIPAVGVAEEGVVEKTEAVRGVYHLWEERGVVVEGGDSTASPGPEGKSQKS